MTTYGTPFIVRHATKIRDAAHFCADNACGLAHEMADRDTANFRSPGA